MEPKNEAAPNVNFAKLLQIPEHFPNMDLTEVLRNAIEEKNQDILDQLKEVQNQQIQDQNKN